MLYKVPKETGFQERVPPYEQAPQEIILAAKGGFSSPRLPLDKGTYSGRAIKGGIRKKI